MSTRVSNELKNLYKSNITVLHVEDNVKVREKFANELYKRNIFVHSVDNLFDAVKILKKCDIQYLVCDGRFPSLPKGAGGIANFIPLVETVNKLNKKTTIIGWANSSSAHEYCRKNNLESYSKIKLSRSFFAERKKKFIDIKETTSKRLAGIIEEKIAINSGFSDAVKKLKFEHYYNEPGTIFGMFMAADVRTKLFKKTAGVNYGPWISEINNGMLAVYVDKSNDTIIADSIFKKITERNFFSEISRNVDSRSKKLLKFSRNLRIANLVNYTNDELKSLYLQFCYLFLSMRMYSSLPTAMEHETNTWSNFLNVILKEKIKNREELNEIFSLLTTPVKRSYLDIFEFELAKIGYKKYCGNNIDKNIYDILERFNWINYHFEGIPLTRKEIKAKIIQLGKSKKDFIRLIDDHKKSFKSLQLAKEKAYKKYSFSKKEIELFDIGSEIVYIKFYRKGVFAESYYSVEFLLGEIGKRIGCTRKQVSNMTANEVLAALDLNFFPNALVDQRIKESLAFHSNGETVILGKYAKKLLKNHISKEKFELRNVIQGQVAYPGKVRGKVKIVNILDDMKKFKLNDVLVSRSTNPALLFAIKRSSAIITDLGGLTCHAAIVARELKKPCVVGAKLATSVLKDGDMVEVDANKGVVKIIKRAK